MVDTEQRLREHKTDGMLSLSALEYRLLLRVPESQGQAYAQPRRSCSRRSGTRPGDFVNDNTLTVYIKRLREKIETDPADPQIIRTVRGIGYMVDA